MIQRDREDALVAMTQEGAGRLLDPLAVDELEQRLPGDRGEDPMEVKRRERRHAGEGGKRQLVGQMLADVVDDAVDALLILQAVARRYRSTPPLASHRAPSYRSRPGV